MFTTRKSKKTLYDIALMAKKGELVFKTNLDSMDFSLENLTYMFKEAFNANSITIKLIRDKESNLINDGPLYEFNLDVNLNENFKEIENKNRYVYLVEENDKFLAYLLVALFGSIKNKEGVKEVFSIKHTLKEGIDSLDLLLVNEEDLKENKNECFPIKELMSIYNKEFLDVNTFLFFIRLNTLMEKLGLGEAKKLTFLETSAQMFFKKFYVDILVDLVVKNTQVAD